MGLISIRSLPSHHIILASVRRRAFFHRACIIIIRIPAHTSIIIKALIFIALLNNSRAVRAWTLLFSLPSIRCLALPPTKHNILVEGWAISVKDPRILLQAALGGVPWEGGAWLSPRGGGLCGQPGGWLSTKPPPLGSTEWGGGAWSGG